MRYNHVAETGVMVFSNTRGKEISCDEQAFRASQECGKENMYNDGKKDLVR